MSAEREDRGMQARAMELAMDLACAHGFDADATLQEAIVDALVGFGLAEHERVCAALLDEYGAIAQQRGPWREQGYEPTAQVRRGAARMALRRVAERLGVHDLPARDLVALLAAVPTPEEEDAP